MKFNHFRVSRDSLLDRFGSVDEAGNYSSPIADDGKRFAQSVSCLSGGRVIIARVSQENAFAGLSIAMRYSCVRRQFGKPDNETLICLLYTSPSPRDRG